MTAQVEILVDRRENVLYVPVQAILEYNGKQHVTKKVGDRFERLEVEVGVSNEKFVQVTKGLAEGDLVVLNPISLMTEEEKREAFRSTAKEAKKDWAPGEAPVGAPGTAGAAGPGAGGVTKGGVPGAPGKPGDPAKAKSKTKKGGRGGNNPFFQKFSKISPEDRARMKTASPEERAEILRKAGFTDEELEQMKNFGGGRGGFGGGGPGGGGGGGRGRAGGGGGSDE
jgi:hypothetical protein